MHCLGSGRIYNGWRGWLNARADKENNALTVDEMEGSKLAVCLTKVRQAVTLRAVLFSGHFSTIPDNHTGFISSLDIAGAR